jgi:hypothetical protein
MCATEARALPKSLLLCKFSDAGNDEARHKLS